MDANKLKEIEEKGRKVTVDIVKANIFALVIMLVAALVLIVPFVYIWGVRNSSIGMFGDTRQLGVAILVFVIGIVVHELIHGITWSFFAPQGWKSISFGVIWKMLTPYCHCDDPMRIPGYMLGAIMPCIVLGIIPSIVALCIGNFPLLAWGIVFIAAAAGDLWMTWLLTKENPRSMVFDHPTEAGFYIID